MPKSAHPLLLLAFCLSLTGCASGFHGGYYDPYAGCVYGPGFHNAGGPREPSLLTKLFRKEHKHEHDCPLCAAEHAHGHPENWGAVTPASYTQAAAGQGAITQASYSQGAYTQASYAHGGYTQASYATPDCAAPNCAAPTPVSPGCSAPAGCSGCSGPTGCSGPSTCSGCSGPIYDSGPYVSAPSGCSSCGGYVESAPFTSGCSGCSGEVMPGCSGCSGGSVSGCSGCSGEPIPSGCSACGGGTTGPIYEGEVLPGDSPGGPINPVPAPGAEPDMPTTQVTPGPETTMMIPAFEEQQPVRQVHWVPSSLK